MSHLTAGVFLSYLLLLAFTGVFGLSGAGGRRLALRAKRIGARARGITRAHAGPQLRLGRQGGLDALAAKILPRPAALRHRLLASGLRLSIGGYLRLCAVVALVVTVLTASFAAPIPVAVMVGLLAGLLLPHLFVGSRVGARRKKFTKLFPDAIGLMVRGLKAGLPVTESILIVGRECADPLGEEFRRVGDQVRLGQPLEEAMWTVARRLSLQEFTFLVITLGIQRETGGNLAETLQNLDSMIRSRAQMRLKIKAMASEATATAMIIGSLPFVMAILLLIVSRHYITTLFISSLGHILLAGGFVWLALGLFVMSQMVKFEI